MAEFYNGLVDYRGQPIRKAELTEEQAGPTTRGVRQHWGDHPANGLTPGRLANILRESIEGDPLRYLELAEDMEERHEHYAAVLSTRKLQVAGLEITVEAASEDAGDIEKADLVREVIGRDEFQDELIDILDALGKGFSATEIVWETSARQWMPVALKHRDARWFTFCADDGDTLLLKQPDGDEELKAYSWIVHRAKVKTGLTIRGGLARGVAWSFLFKNYTAKDWAIFCEAYGQPLRVGKYGPGATDEDKSTLLRAVAGIASDFAAIMPESMSVEFVKADISGSHELYEKRSKYLDEQISKLVLGQVGTTDAVAGGFSGNKVHNEVREDIERADARQLSATLNRDLVRPLVTLNFGPQAKYPKLKIGRPDEQDIKSLVDNVAKLVPLGLKVSMSTMRDKIGVPDPDEDEELLVAPRLAEPANDKVDHEDKGAQKTEAAALQNQTDADAIDAAIELALVDEGWEQLVSPVVDGLQEEIAAAQSAEEVRDILRDRARGLDVSALTDMLAGLTFAARISGEADERLD